VPFLSGRLKIRAAATAYAIGQINFLFDKSFEPYTDAGDLCDYFDTKKAQHRRKPELSMICLKWGTGIMSFPQPV